MRNAINIIHIDGVFFFHPIHGVSLGGFFDRLNDAFLFHLVCADVTLFTVEIMSSVNFAFVEVANGFRGRVFPGYRSFDRFLVHNYLRGWGESGETPSVGGFTEQNLRECTPKFSSGQTLITEAWYLQWVQIPGFCFASFSAIMLT